MSGLQGLFLSGHCPPLPSAGTQLTAGAASAAEISARRVSDAFIPTRADTAANRSFSAGVRRRVTNSLATSATSFRLPIIRPFHLLYGPKQKRITLHSQGDPFCCYLLFIATRGTMRRTAAHVRFISLETPTIPCQESRRRFCFLSSDCITPLHELASIFGLPDRIFRTLVLRIHK